MLGGDQFRNFRDLGGVVTTDGLILRTGLLFRSSDPSRLGPAGRAQLEALGVRLVCDLRSVEEHRASRIQPAANWPVRVVNIPLDEPGIQRHARRAVPGLLLGRDGANRGRALFTRYYEAMAFERSRQIGMALSYLARELPRPALFHCTAGKDRTGLLAALLQLAAGVSFETALVEYLKSNHAIEPRLNRLIPAARLLTLGRASAERLRFLLLAQPCYLQHVYVEIVSRHGSVERYLGDACGLSADDLKRLRAHLRGEI